MEKRKQFEQRCNPNSIVFPLMDYNNNIIRNDRRKLADHRLNNIGIRWQSNHLLIRYQDDIRDIPPSSDSITIGRNLQSNIVIHDRHTSRNHMSIDYVDDANEFVITDQSTNGTFLNTDIDGIVFIQDDTLCLSGNGIISLGKPIQNNDNDLIHFFVTK